MGAPGGRASPRQSPRTRAGATARPSSCSIGHSRIVETHRPLGKRIHVLVHQFVGAAADLSGRAFGHHLAVGQQDHVVRDVEGFLDFVRHEKTGQPHGVVELANQPRHRVKRDGVEAGERLVVKGQVRVQGNGPRQRDAPGHAAGQRAGHQVPRAAQAHGVELHEHDVADQGFRQVGVFAQRKRHILKDADVGEERAELEHHAHAAPHRMELLRVHAGHVLAFEEHFAGLRPVLAADHAQHGGLARAHRPDQRRDLPLRDAEGHVVQDDALPVPEGHVAQFDDRWCGAVHGSGAGWHALP